MSDKLAQYTFLPWLRQGLARYIDQPDSLDKDGHSNADVRANFSLQLRILGDGEEVSTTPKYFPLVGPGDVAGIMPQAIVKMEPNLGETDFEPNYLPYVEFFDEDFPWRYTPAKAVGTKLRPWLALVVLEASEFGRQASTLLPSIHIDEGAENGPFPPANQSHLWAHVHINGNIRQPNQSVDLEKDIETFADTLKSNPNIAHSRLICPRRLKPKTKYHAFLIPAFEQGRRAGLGLNNEDIFAVNSQMSSWGGTHSILANQWPIYFEWEFQTGIGDFELLVERLETRALASEVGRKKMDVNNPALGLTHRQSVDFEGALRPIGRQNRHFDNRSYQERLAQILNLNESLYEGEKTQLEFEEFFGASNEEDDPFVLPPIYGNIYTDRNFVKVKGESWLDEVNTYPNYRAAAGLGAKVIQENQEQYMDQAWEQAGELEAVTNKLRLGQLSIELSSKLYQKHLINLRPEERLAVTAPIHRKVLIPVDGNKQVTVAKTIKDSATPNAFVQSSFFKLNIKATKSVSWKKSKGNSLVGQSINRNFANTPLLTSLKFTATNNTSIQETEVSKPALPLARTANQLFEEIIPLKTVQNKINSQVRMPKKRLSPKIDDPMYLALKKCSLDYLLPNLHLIPKHTVALLETNRPFIESFMLGLNDEMRKELIWREFPLSGKATFFRQFWDAGDQEEPQFDIAPISRWKEVLGNNLPGNKKAGDQLVILLRSPLVSRYPNLISYFSINTKNQEFLDVNDKASVYFPVFSASITKDIMLISFNISSEEVLSHPGAYLVIKERPGELRFGLDVQWTVKNINRLRSWDDLSWKNLREGTDAMGLTTKDYIEASPGKQLKGHKWGANSANMAAILLQKPVMIAIHAQSLLK